MPLPSSSLFRSRSTGNSFIALKIAIFVAIVVYPPGCSGEGEFARHDSFSVLIHLHIQHLDQSVCFIGVLAVAMQ